MKRIGLLISSFVITLLTTFQLFAQTASQPVQYSLTLDPDGTYKVWMKSITAYTGNDAKIGTAQVSLVVPTATNFTVSNLTSANGMSWTTTNQSRINNPSVGSTPTGNDYVVFNYVNSTNLAFDIAPNTDILLFSFKNSMACAGALALWTSTDPYQVPNADNFNVGNQITIFGAGFGNRWNSNYGTSPVPCNAPPTPNLQVTITPPANIIQNSPAIFAVNVSNVGTGPTTGTTTVTTPIPTGMTYNNFSGNGWTCNQVATNVVCTNPNVIPATGNSPYNLTFTPSQTGGTGISATVSGGGDPTPSTSPTSNFTVNPVVPACLIQYKITTEADGSYKVWMKSNTTFTGTAATIGTAQVTVLAPNSTHLVVSNLTGFNGMTWTTSAQTRLDNPTQNSSLDYIVFNFIQANSPTVFDIIANVEYPLFSFKNSASCVGALSLWASTDPIQVPNIQNFNVGNQISVNGAGIGNKWCTNYGTTAPCPVVLSPNLTVNISAPSSTTVGTPTTINLTLTNTGTGPTTSPLTITTPIPAGTTFTGSTGLGWTCSQVNTNVVCTNPNTLSPNGGTSSLGLTFTPTQAGTPTFTTTISGGGLPNPVTSSPFQITVNPVVGNPLLAVSLTAPATGTQNVPYNYSVLVSNNGNAPTTGTTTVTLPLPTGVNFTSSTGAGWTCSQQNTSVVCTNPNPIAAGSNSPLTISVTPTVSGTVSTFAFTSGGGANNAFSTLVNTIISPAVVNQPNIIISSVTNPSTAFTGTPFIQSINITNNGNATCLSSLSYSATLPTGISFSAVNSGWTCTQTSQNLNCVYNTSVGAGVTVPLNIQFVANQPISTAINGVLSSSCIIGGSSNINGSTINITNNQNTNCTANDCGIGVRYGIKVSADGKTYTVYMKSASSFTGGSARIGTAQVTLKVPHGTGLNRFIPTNISGNATTGNMTWTTTNGSRVDAPSIDVNNDYIFFGFSQSTSPALFDIVANQEYPLFSFQNLNSCSGTVGLWETTDPFQAGFQSLNPGNQMTILGNGTANAWKCNYTCALPCQLPSDLTISAVQPSPALSVGQTSIINLTVTNLSNTNNGTITLTTTLPAGVTTPQASFTVGTWSCTRLNQIVTCTNPNTGGLAQNATLSLALPIVPSASNAGQFLTFGFMVASIGTDSNTGNNSTSLITTLPVTAPNLAINIPTFTLSAGQSSNVTVNVVNNGNIAANGTLTTTITLPSGATAPANFSSNGWNCTTLGQTITCTNPNASGLAPNASLAIIVPVSTPANAVSGQTVTILANITVILNESNTNDNSTSGQGTLLSQPNLKLVKSASAIASQGTQFDFLFTVYNIGGTNSTGLITVTDTLRNGLKYISSASSGWACAKIGVDTQNNDIVQCTTSAVHLANSGNSSNFTIRVNPTTATTASNIAYLAGGGMATTTPSSPCTNCSTGSTSVFIQPSPDLTVVVIQPTPVLIVGQTSVLTINITNSGGTVVNSPLTVNITLPAGMTMPSSFTSGIWTCTSSGQNVVCTNPNPNGLNTGGQVTLNLNIVPPIALLGSSPTFIINVVSIPGESNTGNNTFTLIVNPPVAQGVTPDLTIAISQPASLIVGQASTMGITVTNIGQGTATGQLTVTMAVPNGMSIANGTSNGWTISVLNGIMTATHPNPTGLLANGSSTFNISVTPNANAVNSQPTFIAIVNLAPNELNNSNNTAILITTMGVSTSGTPNLVINFVSGGTFVANQATTLNISVMNSGSVAANGQLTVVITLPNGFSAPATFNTNGWTGTTNGQTITLTFPNASGLASGGLLFLQIPVTPSIALVNTIPTTFTFNITPISGEIVLIDNIIYYTPIYPVLGSNGSNIVINITQPIPSFVVNQPSLFTINFINTGNAPQSGPMTINITLPSGLTVPQNFTSGGWTCTTVGQNLTCTNPNGSGVQPNSLINIVLPITPSNSLNGQIPAPLYIYLNGSTIPFIYTFNTAVSPTSAPQLVVNVGTFNTPMTAGQTYYIPFNITNVGSLPANGTLTVNVTLPNGMTAPSSFSQGGWVCSTNGQLMTCTNTNPSGLATNGSIMILIPVTPSNSLIGTNPSITVTINPISGQIITTNNTIIYVIYPAILPSSAPDLTVQITAPSPAFVAGQVSNMTVTVQNIGSIMANGQLTVSFTLPANFSLSSNPLTSGSWTCSSVGQNVTCTNPNNLGLVAGGSTSFILAIRPNMAAVGSTFNIVLNASPVSGEIIIINNNFTLNVLVPVIADPNTVINLSLVESYNQGATYYQNTPFNYSFLLINTSSILATNSNIVVTDTLRFGLKFISGSGSGWSINKIGVDLQGNDIVQAIFTGSLSANNSSVFTMLVNPTQTGTIYNQSFVSGGGMTITIKGSAPCIGCTISPTGPIIINQAVNFNIAVKAILQGSYMASNALMHDSLRVKNLIPLNNPYTSMSGFTQVGSGSETTTSTVLAVSGSNAIVDWVLIELRNASNPSQIVATKAGLIQRDGDIVSATDGVSPVQFSSIASGNYYVAIRHRNHLGAMSASPILLGASTAMLDLTNPSQPAYKLTGLASTNYPQQVLGGKAMMWAGNAVTNNQIIFQGPNNDVDMIFFTIISDPLNTQVISNFIHRGYDNSDINMDGKTVFQGPDNEVDIIFFNVLLHPENPSFLANFIIWQQIP